MAGREDKKGGEGGEITKQEQPKISFTPSLDFHRTIIQLKKLLSPSSSRPPYLGVLPGRVPDLGVAHLADVHKRQAPHAGPNQIVDQMPSQCLHVFEAC